MNVKMLATIVTTMLMMPNAMMAVALVDGMENRKEVM